MGQIAEVPHSHVCVAALTLSQDSLSGNTVALSSSTLIVVEAGLSLWVMGAVSQYPMLSLFLLSSLSRFPMSVSMLSWRSRRFTLLLSTGLMSWIFM